MHSLLNIIIAQDAYKYSHPFVVRPDVTGLTSYIEPRSSWAEEIVFFGIQAFIRKYLETPLTLRDVNKAAMIAQSAFIPFAKDLYLAVVNECGGYLPFTIQALPEGTPVKAGIPVVQITCTNAKFAPLLSVIETALLRGVWYTSSVATLSREIKKQLKKFIVETSDVDPSAILPYMLNDFGARGSSSGETAAIGGLAHLVNFVGSDTLEAIPAAMEYYDHNLATDGPVLMSVPATEHSVTTINGEDGECDFIGHVLKTFADSPIVSIVADSYDLERFVSEYIGKVHKEEILARFGTVVIRPDSGESTEMVPLVLRLLDQAFGSTINSKGYKVLNDSVRVIQGDGIDRHSIPMILLAVVDAGYSVENLVFGMGGKLQQGVMRDDHSWAMKTNAVRFDGDWIDVQKKPKTDSSKTSKAGRQAVVFYDGAYHAIREDALPKGDAAHGVRNFLEPIWENGKVLRTQKLKEIREIAELA